MSKLKKFSFKERLPDILFESSFIVFALLLAFYIEQWQQDQEKMEFAARAKQAIIAELEDNHQKLVGAIEQHKALVIHHQQHINNHKTEDGMLDTIDFDFNMTLLSSAAWESAIMSQAVQNFELTELSSISQIYQVQELYLQSQNHIIEMVMQIGEKDATTLLNFSEALLFRLEVLIQMNDNLAAGMGSTIEDLKQASAKKTDTSQ